MGRQISIDCTFPNWKCELTSAALEVDSGGSIAVSPMALFGAFQPLMLGSLLGGSCPHFGHCQWRRARRRRVEKPRLRSLTHILFLRALSAAVSVAEMK